MKLKWVWHPLLCLFDSIACVAIASLASQNRINRKRNRRVSASSRLNTFSRLQRRHVPRSGRTQRGMTTSLQTRSFALRIVESPLRLSQAPSLQSGESLRQPRGLEERARTAEVASEFNGKGNVCRRARRSLGWEIRPGPSLPGPFTRRSLCAVAAHSR